MKRTFTNTQINKELALLLQNKMLLDSHLTNEGLKQLSKFAIKKYSDGRFAVQWVLIFGLINIRATKKYDSEFEAIQRLVVMASLNEYVTSIFYKWLQTKF